MSIQSNPLNARSKRAVVSTRQIEGASNCSPRRPAGACRWTTVLLQGLQSSGSVPPPGFSGQGELRRRRSYYPTVGTPDPLGCRRRAVGTARGFGGDGRLGRGRRRESEGVQGIGADGADSAPVSSPSAPAHPSWGPEPRQRSPSGPAPPRAPATSAQPGRETPLGFCWATRAKRWREGGGRSGARTPTRAEPAGEAERAWEPGAGVAGPPPATAECPRCLPAGPLRKALSPRRSLCRRLPARRPYNPPSCSPPRSPERRQRGAAQSSATPGQPQVGRAGTGARGRDPSRGSEAGIGVSGSRGASRGNCPRDLASVAGGAGVGLLVDSSWCLGNLWACFLPTLSTTGSRRSPSRETA